MNLRELLWTEERWGGEGKEVGKKPEQACPGGRGELGRYGASGDVAGRGTSWLDWGENGDRHWHSEKQCSRAGCSVMGRFKITV